MKCCHGSNNNQENGHKNNHKGHMSHIWMMILCCGAPVLLLFLLPLIGNTFPEISGYLSKIIPFLCPILMIAMIPMMLKKDHGNTEKKTCENKQLKGDI